MTTLQLATFREFVGSISATITNNWPTYNTIPLPGSGGSVTGDGTSLRVTTAGYYVVVVYFDLTANSAGGDVWYILRVAGVDRVNERKGASVVTGGRYGGTWSGMLAANDAIQLFATSTLNSPMGAQASSLTKVTFVPSPDYRI